MAIGHILELDIEKEFSACFGMSTLTISSCASLQVQMVWPICAVFCGEF